jgi:hypothetical protein
MEGTCIDIFLGGDLLHNVIAFSFLPQRLQGIGCGLSSHFISTVYNLFLFSSSEEVHVSSNNIKGRG